MSLIPKFWLHWLLVVTVLTLCFGVGIRLLPIQFEQFTFWLLCSGVDR